MIELIVRRWPLAGFGSYMLSTATMMQDILDRGNTPVVDYRQRESMLLYRTWTGENVWDSFFLQDVSINEAMSRERTHLSYQGFVDAGRRLKYKPKDVIHLLKFQPRLMARWDLFKSKHQLHDRYSCVYYRGTDKHTEAVPAEFSKYDHALKTFKERVVVQTDEKASVDYCLKIRPDALVFDELRHSEDGRPLHQDDSPKYQRGVEAFLVIMIMANAHRLHASISNLTHVANCYRSNKEATVITNKKV